MLETILIVLFAGWVLLGLVWVGLCILAWVIARWQEALDADQGSW